VLQVFRQCRDNGLDLALVIGAKGINHLPGDLVSGAEPCKSL
jgi:hypothetical protein